MSPRRIVCLTAETTELLYLLGGRMLGAMVGAQTRCEVLIASIERELHAAREAGAHLPRPRVDILQPGPAALTDGLRQLQRLIAACANLQAA